MRIPQRSGHLGAGRALLLAVVLAVPCRVCGAEPLETICAAFHAASQGLTSGIGKGTYRHYEAVTGGDWQLKQDADLTTYFDGKKYYIELKYHRDEPLMRVDSRRIIFDGKAVTEASFVTASITLGALGDPSDRAGMAASIPLRRYHESTARTKNERPSTVDPAPA